MTVADEEHSDDGSDTSEDLFVGLVQHVTTNSESISKKREKEENKVNSLLQPTTDGLYCDQDISQGTIGESV